jgi:hypothetical protein
MNRPNNELSTSTQLEVEGSYNYGEIASDDAFRAKVGYKCLFCSRRHVQVINGRGTARNGVTVEVKCNGESIRVIPYRPSSQH